MTNEIATPAVRRRSTGCSAFALALPVTSRSGQSAKCLRARRQPVWRRHVPRRQLVSCVVPSGPSKPPSSRPEDYVQVRVYALGPPDPPSSATLLTLLPVSSSAPAVPSGKIAFRVAVSDHQAAAIRDVILGSQTPSVSDFEAPRRPTTHALLLSAISSCDASIAEAAITAMAGDVFVASLHLSLDSLQPLDARPSDAIALAALSGAPLYLRRELLDRWPVSLGSVEADVKAGRCECLPPFAPATPPSDADSASNSGLSEKHGIFAPDKDSDMFVDPSSEVWISAAAAAAAHRRGISSPSSRSNQSSISSPKAGSLASSSTSPGSSVSQSAKRRHPMLARLESLAARLDIAVRLERFQEAASLRDQIERICPVQRMQAELDEACEKEDFARAAALRDQMAEWESTLERWDAEGDVEDVEIVSTLSGKENHLIPKCESGTDPRRLLEFAASAFALGYDVDLDPTAAAGFCVEDETEDCMTEDVEWLSSWEGTAGMGFSMGADDSSRGVNDSHMAANEGLSSSEESSWSEFEDTCPDGQDSIDEVDEGQPSDNSLL